MATKRTNPLNQKLCHPVNHERSTGGQTTTHNPTVQWERVAPKISALLIALLSGQVSMKKNYGLSLFPSCVAESAILAYGILLWATTGGSFWLFWKETGGKKKRRGRCV